MPERTELTMRRRDLTGAQIGLAIISGAKRGKVDLYGTFKYHLSVHRGAVDRAIEDVNKARNDIRDECAKRDAKNNIVTVEVPGRGPNSVEVVLRDPIEFEKLEKELLDGEVTISVSVPKLKLDDIIALDFGEQQGDFSGALMFIATPDDDAKKAETPAEARREA